jgi:hypothetical protein
MSGRVSIALILLAAVALTLAPVRALQHGVAEWFGFVRVAAVLIAAWGLARRVAWTRWLVTLLVVLLVWAVARLGSAGRVSQLGLLITSCGGQGEPSGHSSWPAPLRLHGGPATRSLTQLNTPCLRNQRLERPPKDRAAKLVRRIGGQAEAWPSSPRGPRELAVAGPRRSFWVFGLMQER